MTILNFLKLKKEIRKIKKEHFIYTRNNAFLTFCVYLKLTPELQNLLVKNTKVTQKDIKEKKIDKILVQYHQEKEQYSYDFISENETINFPILNTPYLNRLVKQLSY